MSEIFALGFDGFRSLLKFTIIISMFCVGFSVFTISCYWFIIATQWVIALGTMGALK